MEKCFFFKYKFLPIVSEFSFTFPIWPQQGTVLMVRSPDFFFFFFLHKISHVSDWGLSCSSLALRPAILAIFMFYPPVQWNMNEAVQCPFHVVLSNIHWHQTPTTATVAIEYHKKYASSSWLLWFCRLSPVPNFLQGFTRLSDLCLDRAIFRQEGNVISMIRLPVEHQDLGRCC